MRITTACCLLAFTLSVVCSKPVPEEGEQHGEPTQIPSANPNDYQQPQAGENAASHHTNNQYQNEASVVKTKPKTKRKRSAVPVVKKRSKRAVYEIVEVEPEDLEEELPAVQPDYEDEDYDDGEDEVVLVPVSDDDVVSDEIPSRKRRGYYSRSPYGRSVYSSYRRYGRGAPIVEDDYQDYQDEDQGPALVAYEVPDDVAEELLASDDDIEGDPLETLVGDRRRLYDLLAETAEKLNGD